MYIFFDRKPRGKWRQRCFGKEEKKNRICSRSDDRRQGRAAHGGRRKGGEKNPIGNLAAYVRFLTERRCLEALLRVVVGGAAAAHSALRCLAGSLVTRGAAQILRKSATRLVGEEVVVEEEEKEGGVGLLLQSKQARIRLQAQIQREKCQRQERAFRPRSRGWRRGV